MTSRSNFEVSKEEEIIRRDLYSSLTELIYLYLLKYIYLLNWFVTSVGCYFLISVMYVIHTLNIPLLNVYQSTDRVHC